MTNILQYFTPESPQMLWPVFIKRVQAACCSPRNARCGPSPTICSGGGCKTVWKESDSGQ